MVASTNANFLKIVRRAEANAPDVLISTFVDVGLLMTMLSSRDHQIVYGRRGTGKTHALVYLGDQQQKRGDAVSEIDLRTLGSVGGLYGKEPDLARRAGSIFIDLMLAVHGHLLEYCVKHAERENLAVTGPLLDRLVEALTRVRTIGAVETATKFTLEREAGTDVQLGVGPEGASLGIESKELSRKAAEAERKVSGTEEPHVLFAEVRNALQSVMNSMTGRTCWVLLDEWVHVPADVQPYLADFLRRTLLATKGVVVKIAAIEHRATFRRQDGASYIGFELGADITADVNLDDFMVFDNNAQQAHDFFLRLLLKHYMSVREADDGIQDGDQLVAAAFTQIGTFDELVKAAEGVPRDAINILGLAAQRALDNKISTPDIRIAASNWFSRDKEAPVQDATLQKLLHWIRDRVIGSRRARAFLLKADRSDAGIEALYDARVLHILKRSVSTNDNPGVRYRVYKLDYGCYVGLFGTRGSPEGLLPGMSETEALQAITHGEAPAVPHDDYRSIRRAILDIDEFHRALMEGRT